MGESLRGESTPRLLVEGAFVECTQNLGVALRPDHDHHRFVVLRRGANHRRPADVDLLDRLLESDAVAQDRVHEGIEVAAHEVDLPQAMLLERVHVLAAVAPCQDASVHARVKSLDPAVHHLGKAGQVADRAHIDGRVLDRLERAAGGEKLVAEALQAAREGREPGFVANG